MKDRTSKLLLTLIVLGLWAVVLRPLWEPTPARAQAEKSTHAKYEYWIAVGDDAEKMQKDLSEWGKDGWRAVSLAVHVRGGFQTPEIVVLTERKTEF